MKTFAVSGSLWKKDSLKKRVQVSFNLTVSAESESHARDVSFSVLGSKYGVGRSRIKIDGVEVAKE